MSIRIALDNPAEFYTNLDVIRGHVVISLSRNEHIGAVIVKLEGESKTALGLPPDGSAAGISHRELAPSGDILVENHKILYKVAQVFPDENKPMLPVPIILAPGTHRFPFQFRFPFNNACSDPEAMARIGGLAGPGGLGSGSGLFGLGGIRVMDGTKQLMYTHVKKTLPPSFTGFPGEAEIRYYVKVTIQRPGLFRENWRYQIGLKFLPIEPPRPAKTNQEAYARRPFTFKPKSRSPSPAPETKKRSNLFNWQGSKQQSNGTLAASPTSPASGATLDPPPPASPSIMSPTVEVSARLPHPAILTCNKPIPLRILAKKMEPVDADVFLIALQIDLVAQTIVKCQDLVHTELTRWVIVSKQGLSVPVSRPGDAVGAELIVPDVLWRDVPLPNTVMPSFSACNLSRTYQLDVKIGLAWGKPQPSSKGKSRLSEVPQEIHLPLHFSSVEVFSGLAPSPELLEAMRRGRVQRRQTTKPSRPPALTPQPQLQHQMPPRPSSVSPQRPPQLPPRQGTFPTSQAPQSPPLHSPRPHQAHDPLYPPQLRPGQMPGQSAPPYDDAPPSYDEAMAEMMTGPVVPSTARPAYSGVTNENEPSTLPEKN
ncbi:hypothetical protein B0T16DRAFT_322251 [Cercophora newfieldiana]|uniref:Arrestin-like N-terminal domain-containing protein n=1 Tax=Cercophora newfieldiana TaxID=92897 RepID=A0AA39YHX1_9PEZI|nr:hypothetical protein B0T16DRAFT_322251 [Cercophora newfieldiana]